MRPGRAIEKPRAGVHVLAASLAANLLALALPLVLMQVYDRILPSQNTATLLVLSAGLVLALTLETGLRAARVRLMSFAGARDEVAMSRALHRSLLDADLGAIEREPVGVHMDRLECVDRLSDARHGDAATASIDLPFAALFLAVVLLIAPPVAALVAVIIVAGRLAAQRISAARAELAADRSEIDGRRTAFLIELLGGIATVKSLGAAAFMERRYERLMASKATLTHALAANAALAQGVTSTAAAATPFLVATAGAALVIEGALTVGALAAVILLSSRAAQQIMRATSLEEDEREARRLESDVAKTLTLPRHTGRHRSLDGIETVTAERLTIAAEGREAPLLKGIDLAVRRGEAVAIHGKVGCGKTLLLNALAGHVAPQDGRVLVNGADLLDYEPRSLRRHIGFLPQQHRLLEGTLFENMTRFRPEEHGAEALALADALGIERFLADHHLGLSIRIRRGVDFGLPSAVVDRVALVAALVGSPSLILFDESNLSLDAEGDRRLREILAARRSKAAMLFVSQRPSYLSLCDRRFALVDGALVEDTDPPVPHVEPLMLENRVRAAGGV